MKYYILIFLWLPLSLFGIVSVLEGDLAIGIVLLFLSTIPFGMLVCYRFKEVDK